MSDLLNTQVTTLEGEPSTLEGFRGNVLLVVNVASECGFTPQYEALEATYLRYKDQGFAVLGFPCNDFGGQEPGSSQQIGEFCSTRFSVTFPMFEKITVVGPSQHPLYSALIAAQPTAIDDGPGFRKGIEDFAQQHGLPAPNPAPGVLWNFEKFLIGRDGEVIARFGSVVKPDDPRVTQAIEAALEK